MEPNYIAPTNETPSIFFSAKSFEMDVCGVCAPHNFQEFRQTLMNSLKEFMSRVTEKMEINFSFSYLNDRSVELIEDMLKKFETVNQNMQVKVNWFYERNNATIQHLGGKLRSKFHGDFNLKALPVVNG